MTDPTEYGQPYQITLTDLWTVFGLGALVGYDIADATCADDEDILGHERS